MGLALGCLLHCLTCYIGAGLNFNERGNNMETLKQVIMRRDDLTSDEADELIEEAKERIREGEDPEEILHYDFGLEPDYVFDLLDY